MATKKPSTEVAKVDTPTVDAEVIPKDVLPKRQAQALDKKIRDAADHAVDTIAELKTLLAGAQKSEIHKALGYPSWPAYVADALGGRLEVSEDRRAKIIDVLQGTGMSVRAIAKATGTSKSKVQRELSQNGTVDRPDTVTGLDGKQRPSKGSKPKPEPKPTPNVVDAEVISDISDKPEAAVVAKRIDTSEAEGIRLRWKFGRLMLTARNGKQRLPNGYLAQLVERTGKSQRELSYRVKFAEQYPTEDELRTAVQSFDSWHDIVQSLARKSKAKDDGTDTSGDETYRFWDLREPSFNDDEYHIQRYVERVADIGLTSERSGTVWDAPLVAEDLPEVLGLDYSRSNNPDYDDAAAAKELAEMLTAALPRIEELRNLLRERSLRGAGT